MQGQDRLKYRLAELMRLLITSGEIIQPEISFHPKLSSNVNPISKGFTRKEFFTFAPPRLRLIKNERIVIKSVRKSDLSGKIKSLKTRSMPFRLRRIIPVTENSRIKRVSRYDLKGQAKKLEFIQDSEVSSIGEHRFIGRVRRDIDFLTDGRIRDEIVPVLRTPVKINPTGWGHFSRDMILGCWELIKGQALEELGYNPEDELSMLAIFPNLELRDYHSAEFDRNSRQLILNMEEKESGKNLKGQNYGRRCAIIIGGLNGSDVTFMAILPM